MFRVTERQLLCGLSTVVDCPLARPHLYDTAKKLAARCNATIAVVECKPSDSAEWRRRLEKRGRAHASGDNGHKPHKPVEWRDLESLIAGYEGCDSWPARFRLNPVPRTSSSSSGVPRRSELAIVPEQLLGSHGDTQLGRHSRLNVRSAGNKCLRLQGGAASLSLHAGAVA
ncbi:hypothetical protein WJX81_000630 [Elliptochloris bilobata]|uniref:Uncharacterized protein n=1 Tax=Elliptochloris bilobata TaxID=381761 RepID=A0AAW1S1B8_9CHLO